MTLKATARPEERAEHDRRERDEGGFDQEADLHHPAAVSDRAQDADLLAPLDDRAGGDDAERGDADDQPEPHEGHDQAVEGERAADGVRQERGERVGLHAVGEERGLERAWRSRPHRRRAAARTGRRWVGARAPNVGRERALRGRDAGHLERRRVGEDADHGEAHVAAGLRVAHVDGDRVEVLVLEVEAAQLERLRARRSCSWCGAERPCRRRRRGRDDVRSRATPGDPSRSRSRGPRARRSCG